MMSGDLIAIGTVVLMVFAILVGLAVIVMQFYVKVEQGYAMIVNTLRETPDVTFTGRLVIPIIHKKEFMNISLKTIEIDRQGSEGLICKDNIRRDLLFDDFEKILYFCIRLWEITIF